MTSYGPTGTLTQEADENVITFHRSFSSPPESVWEALTTEAGITAWLAPEASIETGPGGAVSMKFDEDNAITGTITQWDPYTAFAHTWIINGEVPSAVRYELTPTNTGTDLMLIHTQLPDAMAGGYTPGWHAYLARLDAKLASQPIPDWMDVFQQVAGSYA